MTKPSGIRALAASLGPAFVAAIAYVDPGNVAANLTAGAEHGYLLLWVLVVANAVAVLVQYLSAKLGVVTGRSLPQILGERLPRGPRILYWMQAELAAAATDIAEVIGGAIALNLLFGIPHVLAGLIVGVIAIGLLGVQSRRGQRSFETVILALLATITFAFVAGLFLVHLDVPEMVAGLGPRFDGAGSVILAASMLGATIMPHAIYLHSGLVVDRHGITEGDSAIARMLRITRWDVVLALLVAGTVNIAMLLLAASSLQGVDGTDSIEGAHQAIATALGPAMGVVFAVGLLASGLASSAVGSYAGSAIMEGLIHRRVPVLVRRTVTLAPALLVLSLGVNPTWALVLSQVVLSVAIPFALIPLVRLTSERGLMGGWANGPLLRIVAWIIVALICALNVVLVWLTVTCAA